MLWTYPLTGQCNLQDTLGPRCNCDRNQPPTPSSDLTPALESLGPTVRLQELILPSRSQAPTPGSGFTCQWAGNSPRVSGMLTLPTSEPALAWSPLGFCRQPLHNQAPLTCSICTRQSTATIWARGQPSLPDHPHNEPPTTEESTKLSYWEPLGNIAWVMGREYTAGTHRMSPTRRPLFQGHCN